MSRKYPTDTPLAVIAGYERTQRSERQHPFDTTPGRGRISLVLATRRPAPHAREPSKVSRGPLGGAAAHWRRLQRQIPNAVGERTFLSIH